jgi:hypothetical protein
LLLVEVSSKDKFERLVLCVVSFISFFPIFVVDVHLLASSLDPRLELFRLLNPGSGKNVRMYIRKGLGEKVRRKVKQGCSCSREKEYKVICLSSFKT